MKTLRMALEGNQVEIVEGMFVPMNLGDQQMFDAMYDPDMTAALAMEEVGGVLGKVIEILKKIASGIIAAVKAFVKWLVGGKSPEERKKAVMNVSRALRSIADMRLLKNEQAVSEALRDSDLPAKFGGGLSNEARDILESGAWSKECVLLIELLRNNSSRDALAGSARTMEDAVRAFSRGSESEFTKNNNFAAVLIEKIKTHIDDTSAAQHKLRADANYKLSTDFKSIARDADTIEHLFDLQALAALEEEYSKIMLTVENAMEQIGKEVKRISKEDKTMKSNGQVLTKEFNVYWKQVRTVMESFRHIRRLDSGIKEITYCLASYRIAALEAASKQDDADASEIKSALSEMRAIKKMI